MKTSEQRIFLLRATQEFKKKKKKKKQNNQPVYGSMLIFFSPSM